MPLKPAPLRGNNSNGTTHVMQFTKLLAWKAAIKDKKKSAQELCNSIQFFDDV